MGRERDLLYQFDEVRAITLKLDAAMKLQFLLPEIGDALQDSRTAIGKEAAAQCPRSLAEPQVNTCGLDALVGDPKLAGRDPSAAYRFLKALPRKDARRLGHRLDFSSGTDLKLL